MHDELIIDQHLHTLHTLSWSPRLPHKSMLPLCCPSPVCRRRKRTAGKPLFDGNGEFEQLDKIISVLGTPNEDDWPGLKQLPNWGKVGGWLASRGEVAQLSQSLRVWAVFPV
jgi:hypothetical protein